MNTFTHVPTLQRVLLAAALATVLSRPAVAAPPSPEPTPVAAVAASSASRAPGVPTPKATEAPIAPDYSRALSPQQMTDAWNREMRRLGLYVPVEFNW